MIYNYKSDETVQDVILECFCPLIKDIADEYSTLRRDDMLLIYVPSYIAREIIGRVLEKIEGTWVHTESHNELLYKDDNEVLITLTSDGMIYIEDARSDFGTLVGLEGSVLSYVYDGFSKKDIDLLSSEGDSILIFGFEEEEIENDTDEGAELSTTSTATYLVNGKEVDKNTYEKSVAEFDKKFKEIIDEMNALGVCFGK